jgi:aquaporin Z
MKKYLAEVIGTFALVFCGTGAIIINNETGGTVTHAGIAITFGLIVLAMIYVFGDISGAHINPAVSIGFVLTDRFSKRDLLPYIIAQLMGAFAASGVLKLLFPMDKTLGTTLPFDTAMQSFVLEIILTYFLMMVILFVSQNEKVSHFTGFAVGGTVFLEALFAGPITGASMNPARSIAPAFVSGHLESVWIYIFATIIGAILASLTWRYFEGI